MIYSTVLGTGAYLPEKILTNRDIEKIVDTTDEWITERTGIKSRHIAASHETASSMAEAAARHALDMASLKPSDIDMIIVVTSTPDRAFPGAACLLQERLGIPACPAFDLNSLACAGFIYGLSIADQFIKNGKHRCVLLVGSEIMTRLVDWKDRSTCVLFGDGAGAMLLGASDKAGFLTTHISADGKYKDILYLANEYGGEVVTEKCFMQMQGNALFRVAVNVLEKLFDDTLQEAGLKKEDVNWLIAHQANARIIANMAKKLNLSMDRVPLCIEKHGNTSAASIPLVFDEVVRSGRLKKGETVLFEAIGGGLAWGSAVLRYEG